MFTVKHAYHEKLNKPLITFFSGIMMSLSIFPNCFNLLKLGHNGSALQALVTLCIFYFFYFFTVE